MNEAETRAELTDAALKAAGWGVVEGSRIRRDVRFKVSRVRFMKEQELSRAAAVKESLTVQKEGKRTVKRPHRPTSSP